MSGRFSTPRQGPLPRLHRYSLPGYIFEKVLQAPRRGQLTRLQRKASSNPYHLPLKADNSSEYKAESSTINNVPCILKGVSLNIICPLLFFLSSCRASSCIISRICLNSTNRGAPPDWRFPTSRRGQLHGRVFYNQQCPIHS